MRLGEALASISDLSEAIPEIREEIEKARPVIQAGVEILQSFGPEVKALMTSIVLGLADVQIAAMQKYQDAGYTKAQSIQLVLGTLTNVKNGISTTKKN